VEVLLKIELTVAARGAALDSFGGDDVVRGAAAFARANGLAEFARNAHAACLTEEMDAGRHFARSMYRFSEGSTMISSPSLTKGGTSTVTPFSSVAGLYDAEAVALFTIGCVSAILARTVFGSSMPSGLPS